MVNKGKTGVRILPFRNAELPLEVRVNDLISRLSLEEKAGLVSSKQKGIKRLGISDWYIGTEVARGYVGRTSEEPSTVLPQPIGMAAMFDPKLMYKLGEIAGNEARVYYQKDKKGRLMLWGPTVDMERDPRWGRTEEAYGEDPYLTGQMTIAFTKGLRGEDPYYLRTVPTLKHFCSNNNEVDRGTCSANLEPRTKHEYYYQAFKPAITQGGAMSMMAAYNELSGVPALLNPELKSIVKEQWGLDFIVSDGGDFSGNVIAHKYIDNHAKNIALSIKAGADIMTDDEELVQYSVLEAIRNGYLTENELDESIKRVMSMRFRLGEFDPNEKNPYANIPDDIVNCDQYKELNKQAAKEQVILLKNKGLLPIKKENQKIAVIGPLGDKNYMDWYTGYSTYNISVLEGIKEVFGEDNVTFDNAYSRVSIKSCANNKYLSVKEDERIVANSNEVSEQELFEFHDWDFGSQNLLSLSNHKFVREDQGVKASGESTYGWFVREWLKFKCRDIEENTSVEEKTNAEEKTSAEERVKDRGQTYSIGTWLDHQLMLDDNGILTSTKKSSITESNLFVQEVVSDGIERAAKQAKQSDIAVVCIGNDPLQVARECYDRPDIVLPKHQRDLIKAVYKANPNTVVVIVSSYPYAINWEEEHIPAILYTSHAGPELGTAIAEVLTGSYNPAGRTPMTWYQSIDDLPDIMDYDIIKNNTTYLYYEGKPLYPFGHGLSYSTFQYSSFKIDKLCAFEHDKEETQRLRVSVFVTNTSDVDGEEVVQLYYRANNPRVKRPLKQLCGFKRVMIGAGETVEVIFILNDSSLEFYDVTRDKFCVESGEYTFMVGASSEDIRISDCIYVDGEKIPPQTLRKSTPAINYDDKAGVIMRFCKEKNMHYLSAVGMEAKYIKFKNVCLSGCTSIEITASTAVGKGTIQVFCDSMSNKPIVLIPVPITGGMTQFVTCKGDIMTTENIHDLYFVLDGGVSIMTVKLI